MLKDSFYVACRHSKENADGKSVDSSVDVKIESGQDGSTVPEENKVSNNKAGLVEFLVRFFVFKRDWN